MHFKTLFLFLVLTVQSLFAQVIPSARRTDWSLAGHRGAITVSANIIDITNFAGVGDGLTVNDVAIQNAIASLNGNSSIIYFPSGNYLFQSSIVLNDSIVLKGNSSDSTTLSFDLSGASDLIRVNGSVSNTIARFIANADKDSSFIVLDNPQFFQANDYIKIFQNDSALLFSNWAYGSVGQIVQISTIVGNRINLNSPLRKSFVLNDSCRVRKMLPVKEVGIECLKIKRLDQSLGQTTNIDINYAVNCWVKGVESDTCNFAHIAISNSSNIEISGCYFHDAFAYGGGGQAYGVVAQATSGECLIENNVFNHLRHSMLIQSGANGNVYAYNSSVNPYWVSGALPANSAGDMVLHGNYTFLNLFEGNTGQNIVIDDSHGINGPYNTYFRNRADLYGIFMNSNPPSNNQNFVGNEVTNNGPFMGMYQLSGNGHFAHGNNIKGVIQPANTNTLNDTSYYKKIKPGYIAFNATWPSIGISNIISSGTIPAQQRQLQGSAFTDCTIDYKLVEQIKSDDINKEIKLFPNPCNDRIYIEEITIYEGAHYSFILYNLMGDKVKTLTPVGNEIVLNQVESGSYFYALQNSSIVLLRGKLIVIKVQ